MESDNASSFDCFISHASEDTVAVAVPIAEALVQAGYRVWLDRGELTVGDRLLRKINEGISRSRFGIAVLSPAFFSKNWPQWELEALAAKEDAEGRKVILPVWHELGFKEVERLAPLLAGRYAVETASGLSAVIAELISALRREGAGSDRPGSTPPLMRPVVPSGADDEPGPLDLLADAEGRYEDGGAAVRRLGQSMARFTAALSVYNERNAAITASGQQLSKRELRRVFNEIVPIFD